MFQMVGPQTEKARWRSSCVRVRWTMAARDVVEIRQRRPEETRNIQHKHTRQMV